MKLASDLFSIDYLDDCNILLRMIFFFIIIKSIFDSSYIVEMKSKFQIFIAIVIHLLSCMHTTHIRQANSKFESFFIYSIHISNLNISDGTLCLTISHVNTNTQILRVGKGKANKIQFRRCSTLCTSSFAL